jgi:hypothetical protein
MDAQIESKTEDAARILHHYLKQAIPDINDDAMAEMRDVVSAIVDAACLQMQRNRLAHMAGA